jgi:molybdopterin-guanine dinucleotide biosynthesis protein A
VKCYLLTGGVSQRMGRPKADLELEGRSFLQRTISAALGAGFEELVVIARGPALLPEGAHRLIVDQTHDDTASMYGLARALTDCPDDRLWLLAVDFPLITASILAYLAETFRGSSRAILAPVWHSRPQMLCAGYSTSLGPAVRAAIDAQDFRLQSLLSEGGDELLPESLLRSRFEGEPLWNINRPQDFEELRRYCGEV